MEKGERGALYLLRRNYVRENISVMYFTLMAPMSEGGHNIPVIGAMLTDEQFQPSDQRNGQLADDPIILFRQAKQPSPF